MSGNKNDSTAELTGNEFSLSASGNIDVVQSQKEFCSFSDPASRLTIFFSGLQHFLVMIGGTIQTPYLLFSVYCISLVDPARGELASGVFFVCGITTLLQSFFGSRIPTIHGTSFSYLIPILIILKSPKWKCPDLALNNTQEVWQDRLLMTQGSVMLASLFEIFLSITGLIGFLLRFVSPLSIAPVTTLIGLSMMDSTLELASSNWIISILTIILVVVFEIIRKWKIPCVSCSRREGIKRTKGIPIFQLYPILIATVLVWITCAILTEFNVFPASDKARTDQYMNILSKAPWIRLPLPIQWRYPTYDITLLLGCMAVTLNKIVSTIGNFYSCVKTANAPPPPLYAINRGLLIEGCGTFLDGLIGIGCGIGSYAENISIIGMTKMANRKIMYVAGAMLMFIGIFTKITALAMTIPEPIVGGVLLIVCGSIVSIGLANLRYVDLHSPRNLLTVGIPLFCGLGIPAWLEKYPNYIQTGNESVDNTLTMLLCTNMFVGFIFGLLLDNIIPGTPEERGLANWIGFQNSENHDEYAMPFGNKCSECSCACSKFIPILPGYKPFAFCSYGV